MQTFNKNQQIVLEWLKEEKNNSKLTAFDCIYSFIYGNPEDLVTETWAELNAKEEAQVLEAFGQWVLEQEEGGGRRLKEYCVYWRNKHSNDITWEYIRATYMSYAIEQALEYISEVERLDFEDIDICHVEVIE